MKVSEFHLLNLQTLSYLAEVDRIDLGLNPAASLQDVLPTLLLPHFALDLLMGSNLIDQMRVILHFTFFIFLHVFACKFCV